ncbi:uncharacterized protein CC84DRAFT_1179825 [Paraphaeosphaeria sporulosa]|uniref:Uncharacterized protein n=1 Tax=Paraphaeosphaeria sporulosa TaxID=1460663 RepID=A0A177C4I7_9PLEO|nr:uncharacterized protein CC84DRAFT_1179825 [Paraphaeosphaeria sporulosa]OAG01799.1 hypothetical protein CC84DRAFT_1179825 [Paraphaeosphaeria sporulosa]
MDAILEYRVDDIYYFGGDYFAFRKAPPVLHLFLGTHQIDIRLVGDDERLELVLWGSDEDALAQAARLVPMVTGVGQPDFVALGKRARWKGAEVALALGFFDHNWTVKASSVVS